MDIPIQDVYRTPNGHDHKRTSPYHFMAKMLNIVNKDRILQGSRKKFRSLFGKPIRIIFWFISRDLKNQESLEQYVPTTKRK